MLPAAHHQTNGNRRQGKRGRRKGRAGAGAGAGGVPTKVQSECAVEQQSRAAITHRQQHNRHVLQHKRAVATPPGAGVEHELGVADHTHLIRRAGGARVDGLWRRGGRGAGATAGVAVVACAAAAGAVGGERLDPAGAAAVAVLRCTGAGRRRQRRDGAGAATTQIGVTGAARCHRITGGRGRVEHAGAVRCRRAP
jgi:hypothetical protein